MKRKSLIFIVLGILLFLLFWNHFFEIINGFYEGLTK